MLEIRIQSAMPCAKGLYPTAESTSFDRPHPIRKRVNVKILCRVDIASIKNIKRILEINNLSGFDAIEIKHIEQPLRGIVIDDKIARLREEKRKQDYKEGELQVQKINYINNIRNI